ncbi:sulfatase [Schlesneria sp.]|uniref:sulfatase n=1 Tax=Schlesneria sp. TaxID=2762018 RepID=UPI002F11B9B9
MRFRRWAVNVLAAVWAVSGSMSHLSASPPRKPNILLIVADDLGYADLGFQGGADIPTPAIDSLAAGGVRFTNGYVSGPYCSPTRAGLLTGRYQQRFGHEFNPGGNRAGGNRGGGNRPGPNFSGKGLPLEETTFANRFKDAGYVTGLVGKWHLGGGPEYHPFKRGFDEFFGFLGGAHTYFDKDNAEILRGTEKLTEPTYLTQAFGREAVSFIERHKQEPFLLYLAFNAVHTPMEAEDSELDKFDEIKNETRKTYAAMLSSMDDAIGKVLSKLKDAGLEEETLIFFISDNGGPTMQGTTINGSNNAPLRGSKRTTLEGGIRVPFVVQWKGKLPAGSVYNHPVIQLDFQPTALAAAGVTVDPSWKLDGTNLLPFLDGSQKGIPHETLYWRLGDQNAIRHGEWKLVQYDLNVENYPTTGVSTRKLFHLPTDLNESHDLSEKYPEKVKELESLWQEWNKQLAKPL